MKNNIKLFPGSVIGLLLGVLLAAPLLYTNIVMAPAADGPEPLLGVELTYAYIEQINGTFIPNGTFLPDSQNPNETMKPGIPVVNYFVACNLTRLSEEFDPCDAKFEVYLIKFYSDKGFVGNLGMCEGIIYNSDLLGFPSCFDPKVLFGGKLFDGHQASHRGGSYGKWDVGESRGCGMSGVNLNWGSTFGEPETMFISVSLLGWIALRGNSTDTVILGEPEVVAEVQLEKFGDGFLYNTIIPEDELSEFDPEFDPLNPSWKLFELMGDLN